MIRSSFFAGSLLWIGLVVTWPGCKNGRESATEFTRLGMTAYAKGNYDDAIGYLQRAYELNPQSSTLAHNLACCYALKGDKESAIDYVEKAFDLGNCLFVEDKDLASLHGEPRFARLAKRANAVLDGLSGQERLPVVSLPPGYDGKKSYPWMIALHGYGGNPADFAEYLSGSIAPREAIVCCPYATLPKGESSFAWAEYSDDERTVLAACDYLKRNYQIGQDPGLILGYSQGGSRALYAGLRNPELFGGIIVLAGYYDEGFGPSVTAAGGKTKVCLVIGNQDDLLDSNVRARRLMEDAGIPVRLVVCPGLGHTAPPEEEVAKALEWALK